MFLSGLLNAGVQRFDADQAALNYYERNYTPTGRIGVPVLKRCTPRETSIPFAHEALFAAIGCRTALCSFSVRSIGGDTARLRRQKSCQGFTISSDG